MDFSETITKRLQITQLELPVAIFRVSELSQSGYLLKADNVGMGNGSGRTSGSRVIKFTFSRHIWQVFDKNRWQHFISKENCSLFVHYKEHC